MHGRGVHGGEWADADALPALSSDAPHTAASFPSLAAFTAFTGSSTGKVRLGDS